MSLYDKIKCAWCGSELVKSEQEALKKESQHICFSCCQSDDEYYGTQQHLKNGRSIICQFYIDSYSVKIEGERP